MNLKEFFDAAQEGIKENVRKTLKDCAETVAEDAKSRCPVDTGTLRDSIRAKPVSGTDGTEYKIYAGAKRGNVHYGRIVEFSPVINEPFMYPAMDAHREEIRSKLIESVKAGVSDAQR